MQSVTPRGGVRLRAPQRIERESTLWELAQNVDLQGKIAMLGVTSASGPCPWRPQLCDGQLFNSLLSA